MSLLGGCTMCDDLDVSGGAGLHRVLDALLEADLDSLNEALAVSRIG